MDVEHDGVADEPRFGEADLTNCEREKIHLPGSIQPHGALLTLDEPDLKISRVSENVAEIIGLESWESLIGSNVASVGKDLAAGIKRILADPLDIPDVVTVTLDGSRPEMFDCVVHRSPAKQLVVEVEPASDGDRVLSAQLKSGVDAICAAASLQSLCDVTAQILKQVLGHDRVMVYRFDADGHGQVFAEQREPQLEPYLGNHYPASDIPKVARDLYLKNRVRMLVDVDYTPVPIHPICDAESGSEFDMSMCHLRSMSPMHLQYLRNMEVASTLVASLTAGGSLWGLIACHDSAPRRAGYSARAATELIAEVVATRISALESVGQTRVERAVRRLDQSMIDLVAHDGDWPKALFDNSQGFLRAFDATGAALTYDQEIVSTGSVPSNDQIRELTEWLDENSPGQLFHTAKIGAEPACMRSVGEIAPGVLAVPVSRVGGEYFVWFRPETVRTVVWGGDPRKPVETAVGTAEISPRRSFAQWRELLRETAVPWTMTEISGAKMVGASIRDLVHQIRAVRALIAHNQLETLVDQLKRSDIPGLIANAEGAILLANEALGSLLWRDNPATSHISQIARYFEESSLASHSISELVSHQQPWRGLTTLDSKSVLVRADPVPSADGGALGYIVLLTEVNDSSAVDSIRVPETILEGHASHENRVPETLKAEYESLTAAVLENAQLAAMEIKDGADIDRVRRMLRSVEDSVDRTTRLIGNLVAHAGPVNR